ncbi:hypothetical protein REPUB_Repub13aG0213900 [Reevesia pubescens]
MGDDVRVFSVFVNNIPTRVHWRWLRKIFQWHGMVIDVFIPKKRSSSGKKFGFVRFASLREAKTVAGRLNGAWILDHRIKTIDENIDMVCEYKVFTVRVSETNYEELPCLFCHCNSKANLVCSHSSLGFGSKMNAAMVEHGLKDEQVFVKTKSFIKGLLVIESDSMVAVSWCKDADSRPWRLWNEFMSIDSLLQQDGYVSFSNIFREANGIADHLTKSSVNRSSMFMAWW